MLLDRWQQQCGLWLSVLQQLVIGNESVLIQLAQCWFPGLAISNAKISIYFFQIECMEAILSNSTRKVLWFKITKMLNGLKKIYCVICHNFRHTFVPYT